MTNIEVIAINCSKTFIQTVVMSESSMRNAMHNNVQQPLELLIE